MDAILPVGFDDRVGMGVPSVWGLPWLVGVLLRIPA